MERQRAINEPVNDENKKYKPGLCRNLKNLVWVESVDPNTFFPRAYDLSNGDELELFIGK